MSKDESINREPSRNSKLIRVDTGSIERALFLAGTTCIIGVIANPLDVAKTRLQAQAAGVPYGGLSGNTMLHQRTFKLSTQPKFSPNCTMHYRGTLDLFYKVIREEGLLRLWRGTHANLALAIPSLIGIETIVQDICRKHMEELASHNAPTMTPYVPLLASCLTRSIKLTASYPVELARTRMMAFQHTQADVKPPGVWKTLMGVVSPIKTADSFQDFERYRYRMLWSGLGVTFLCTVCFYVVSCTSIIPLRRKFLSRVVKEGNRVTPLNFMGANFCAGFIAGSLAAATTSPLAVAGTRRRIQNDPTQVLNMTTRRALMEIWRDGGIRGLFAGAGPRVAQSGISMGILIALSQFYIAFCDRNKQLH